MEGCTGEPTGGYYSPILIIWAAIHVWTVSHLGLQIWLAVANPDPELAGGLEDCLRLLLLYLLLGYFVDPTC